MIIRPSVSLAALALALVAGTAAAQPVAGDPQTLEKSFDAMISTADQMRWLQDMSSAPNQVGSPHDKANADMQLALFRQWGWDAHIERFDVLYPTPISTTVEMVTPQRVILGGQEPAIAADPSSQNTAGALPPYVAYQGDGDVTAPVVYVNYGMPDDYDALEQRGISVRGKIVLARYGSGWRGLKPRLAQEHGAVGCLIYSDPADDSYAEADPYPRGGGRPEAGVQRGSVQDMTQYPGDPLTPGIGATASAHRLTRQTATTILKIPALPISYGDAAKIIAQLDGPLVTGAERGGLGLAYHWGGSDAVKVHLAVRSDWSLKPVYDVIAVMRGSVYPDQWIVRGNHHDAWVFGASDPLTGQVALMSEAKALGQLYRQGWRPARTIVYASWDGEEPGLLGSTEWAETHAAELQRKALLYVNTDNNGRGFLGAEGSGELQHLVNQAANDVLDPRTGVPTAERGRAAILAAQYVAPARSSPELVEAARSGGELPLGALGSGSDYSAFLQHLGIASLNLGFGGEDQSGGSYHSVYDSYYHVTHFDDPGLLYGAALSKLVGRIVLRVADAPRVPARYSDFAAQVGRYVDQVMTLAASQRERDRTLADLRRDKVFTLAASPTDPVVAPVDKGVTPLIDMLPLQNASDHLKRAAAAADSVLGRIDRLPPATQAQITAELASIDQLLLDPVGLPSRPWYRNMVYAPGTLTGYGAKTLPGVREGIEQRRFDDARAYVGHTAAAIEAYAARLDAAAALGRPPA
ncbi:transferrin receptor-like dimerization domain-containing protein [Sphingomonas sp.]|uniref:transferrin receptor-like dimerization domain-containing protein n=1 Tax=Sphingomonas sp. TaxID=28214 RepID=UPI0025EE4F3E|nr:transferrin receptor-like dimerization domain-containing protein [Sphingomonas sp.]MBV9527997.1 M28 family peptidase [Sphingomonas sp.]